MIKSKTITAAFILPIKMKVIPERDGIKFIFNKEKFLYHKAGLLLNTASKGPVLIPTKLINFQPLK